MENQSYKLAFAVNNQGNFQMKHFGDAEKFLIFEKKDDTLILIEEKPNMFKNIGAGQENHGLASKGMAIAEYLQKEGIQIVVSRQFGKNVRIIGEYFIPVIIEDESPDDVIVTLERHWKWLMDEIQNQPAKYKLFTLKTGVMKAVIS